MPEPVAVIDGSFRRELPEALLKGFASLSEFRVLVSEALDRELSDILADVLRADAPSLARAVNPTPPELPGVVFDDIRLNGRPAEDVIGKRLRGYVEPIDYKFSENENVIIFQHPGGCPLSHKFGYVTRAADGDWVRYNVNTEGGSSGGPCTTEDLRVVAIHHYGSPHYNRGARFSAILRHLKANRNRLKARGVTGLLGLGA
jgi:hypothetical protein